MNSLKDFFLFCSGIDLGTLSRCKTDENKYVGIGATVFFTGVLAFFSSSYALYTVFDSYPGALFFGLIWGLMIFNLDRYIVSSMKNRGSLWKDLGIAIPRIAMALVLAIVISKPLELKIFEKEINTELVLMEQETYKVQENMVNLRFDEEIAEKRNLITDLKNQIAEKAKIKEELAMIAIQEADGTGGSMNQNLGPIYKVKKQKADLAQIEWEETMAANNMLIDKYENQIGVLESKIEEEVGGIDRSNFGGLAAKMEALHRLTEKSKAIAIANVFILLMFMCIETMPVFVKLISYRSPYDYVIHEHEHVYAMNNLERTSLLTNKVKNKVKYDTEIGAHKIKARIAAEKEMIDIALQQKIDALRNKGVDYNEVFS